MKGNPKLASIKSMSQLQGKLGSKLTYQQYFDLLLEASIQYDLDHQLSYKCYARRSVYQHDIEYLYDNMHDNVEALSINDDNNVNFTTQAHNFDTPVYEFNQLHQSQHPLLPNVTWYSLSQNDKSKWDGLSNSGK